MKFTLFTNAALAIPFLTGALAAPAQDDKSPSYGVTPRLTQARS